MQFIKIALVTLLAGGTIFASAATFAKFGVQDVEQPHGISLRQDSIQTGKTGFFLHYARSRSHQSGGLSGGK